MGEISEWAMQDIKDKFKTRNGKFPTTVWKLGELKLYECPLTWITADTYKILELLFIEENPTRIFQGTWLDQPKWWLEAIQIYKHEKLANIRDNV